MTELLTKKLSAKTIRQLNDYCFGIYKDYLVLNVIEDDPDFILNNKDSFTDEIVEMVEKPKLTLYEKNTKELEKFEKQKQMSFNDNPEALHIIKAFKEGKNLFIQGVAGSGKSTLLKELKKLTKKRIATIAPTGIAAINAGGETIHKFFGFNIEPFGIRDQAKDLGPEHICNDIDILIFDEISMVSASLIHRVDMTLRKTRRNNDPFGGVQVVLVGDMAQLAPIEPKEIAIQYGGIYWFFAPFMREMYFTIEKVILKKNYRQSGDQAFLQILSNIRKGVISNNQLKALNERIARRYGQFALCARNIDADNINSMEFNNLDGMGYVSIAKKEGFFPAKSTIPDILEFKVDMPVMFTKNDPAGAYVNGTMGKIRKVKKSIAEAKFIITVVKENGEYIEVSEVKFPYNGWGKDRYGKAVYKELGSCTQLPFVQAWAISINKSQGLTFKNGYIDMGGGAFAFGQTYVALSRFETMEGITLGKELTRADIKADPVILEFLGE